MRTSVRIYGVAKVLPPDQASCFVSDGEDGIDRPNFE
jgi:hypothetical protein